MDKRTRSKTNGMNDEEIYYVEYQVLMNNGYIDVRNCIIGREFELHDGVVSQVARIEINEQDKSFTLHFANGRKAKTLSGLRTYITRDVGSKH